MSIKSQQTKLQEKYDFNSILLHDNARDPDNLNHSAFHLLKDFSNTNEFMFFLFNCSILTHQKTRKNN